MLVKLQCFFLRALLKKSLSFTEELFQISSSGIHDISLIISTPLKAALAYFLQNDWHQGSQSGVLPQPTVCMQPSKLFIIVYTTAWHNFW